jgi:hypothetical protein
MTGIVFAARGKRLEGLLFRCLYLCYRMLHRFLTGLGICGKFQLDSISLPGQSRDVFGFAFLCSALVAILAFCRCETLKSFRRSFAGLAQGFVASDNGEFGCSMEMAPSGSEISGITSQQHLVEVNS